MGQLIELKQTFIYLFQIPLTEEWAELVVLRQTSCSQIMREVLGRGWKELITVLWPALELFFIRLFSSWLTKDNEVFFFSRN